MVRIGNIDPQHVGIEDIKAQLGETHHLAAICYEVLEGDNLIVYIGFHANASAETAQRQIQGSILAGPGGVEATVI